MQFLLPLEIIKKFHCTFVMFGKGDQNSHKKPLSDEDVLKLPEWCIEKLDMFWDTM